MKPRQVLKRRKQFGKKKKRLLSQTERIKLKKNAIKKEKISKERSRTKRNVPVSTDANLSRGSVKENSKAKRLVEQEAVRQNEVYAAQKDIERRRGKEASSQFSENLNTELIDPLSGDFDKIH